MTVKADGATKVLVISEEKIQATDTEEVVEMEVDLSFKGFGISLIDSHPRELAFISISGVKLEYSISNIDQKVDFIIQNFQVK